MPPESGDGQGLPRSFSVSAINRYLAHKQHLLPEARVADVVQVSRDLVGLHASAVTVPYLSLWARVPGFQRAMLDDALYESRELAKVLCMRVTLHAVPSDEVLLFLHACRDYVERRTPLRYRGGGLLAQAGLCPANEAGALLEEIQHQILDVLGRRGPSTLSEISQHVPELQATILHDEGKAYEGQFSIGSRLISEMCTQALLIRARPRGTWRSNLNEYAPLRDWLPGPGLQPGGPQEARAWLVRRYLSAFGPARYEDVQWWTGFTKTDTEAALETLEPELVQVAIDGLEDGHLMLADDARQLSSFPPTDGPAVFFLPGLDPYIMGYRDRRRYLATEHEVHVLTRDGNAVPTVWVNGQVVGVWGQRRDGSLVYDLFGPVSPGEGVLLTEEAAWLQRFLDGEYLAPRYHTAFSRSLERRSVGPEEGIGA